MRLNQLADNPGARKGKIRVGRGIGSGKGKTGGRGVKGQKSRTGVAIKGFEGGQMPLYRRLPKRGFTSMNPVEYAVINLADIQRFIDSGKLKAGETVTSDALVEKGIIRRKLDGVKLLAKGKLNDKITLKIDAASAAAIEAVKKAGGSVEVPAKAEKAA
ncbi:50S ribosomal protein L15 [bacterium]|nr:50S ribosomal protein L15 [bacterium]